MSKLVIPLLLAMTMAPWLELTSAHAQSMNTYVSGKGNDGNPCSTNQPCKTLQGALTKTLAGGQIIALDSANYGSLTINQAVSIVSPSSAIGVLAPSSVSGITINAGPSDVINLQGIEIDGAGSGANGIQFTSGSALNIKDSVIRSFTNGISFQPTGNSTLWVGNTLITNNGTGLAVQSSTSRANVLDNVQFVGNSTGLSVSGTNSATPATVTMQNSVVTFSSTIAILSAGSSVITVAKSTVINNGVGLRAQNTGAVLQVSGSTVSGNSTGWAVANGGWLYSSGSNSIAGNSTGNSSLPTTPAPPAPSPTPTPSGAGINVAGLPLGTVAANSLSPTCLTNPTGTVFENAYWTLASTKYLMASTFSQFITKSQPTCNTRDVELTSWTRNGYMYVRLDSSGKAIYFSHNGETTNGYLEIGIVTGLDETSYPGGTYFPLYKNDNLVGTVSGYNKTDTTGAAFTFGVSGFDIYARFNGVEFVRFKEYRQMNSGATALKANTGYGFRAVTILPLTTQYLYSDYANNKLDLRDWNVRSIQTKGTIAGGSQSLRIAARQNFQVGDWVIVEIGAEAGAGARGTIGVGGQWPALYYASATAMTADNRQPVNTFAWTQDDGLVYQWNGLAWTGSFAKRTYYLAKAVPLSLHGRITAISSDGLTLTIDNAATATATDANVYLDNQPYVNYLVANQKDAPGFYADLTPITPANETIVLPAGNYAGSGLIVLDAQAGWTITGQGQDKTTLFAPKGVYSLGIDVRKTFSGYTLSGFTLQGNFGTDKYGLAFSGWTYIPGGLTTSGAMPANPDLDNTAIITQTNVPGGLSYPPGIHITTDNVSVQDIAVNDVPQKAVGVDYGNNVWAYRVTNNQTSVVQSYVQWQFQWANTTGGGCVDCRVNSTALVGGFESFNAVSHQFIRPVSVNGAFSQNNAGGWLIQDATVTVTAASILPPAWSKNNPLVNISTAIGSNYVVSGGTINNMRINVQGYIDSDNDIPTGINVNASNPNVTIIGGSYTAPNYATPSTLMGPQAILSTGANTRVSGFTACGTLSPGLPTVHRANIGIADGSVVNSIAATIVAPVASGNSPCS